MSGPPPLTRSDEIRSIAARFFAAVRRGDVDVVIARHSAAPGITTIGTDPSEFIADYASLVAYLRDQFSSVVDWTASEGEVDAWCEGTVGWAVVRSTLTAAGKTAAYRLTLVLHLEGDDWRIVHEHHSVGVTNEEVFGVPLAYRLDEVATAVEARRPDLGPLASVDGTLTVVFTDIEDSTRLTASYGDRGWIDVLRAHNAIVEEATKGQGGTVVQRVGDGYMLVFPSGRRAIRAALGIQARIGQAFNDPGSPIRVRIGIHTGDVIRERDEFFGQAVNYAARVASAGDGGETLTSRLVRDLVGDDRAFAFGDARDVAMKGFEGDQTVFPVLKASPATG